MRVSRITAALIRSMITAIAVLLVGALPMSHAIAAQPNRPGNSQTPNQPGDTNSGNNSPSQRGGDARTINPRPPQNNTPPQSAPSPGDPDTAAPVDARSRPWPQQLLTRPRRPGLRRPGFWRPRPQPPRRSR